MCEHCKERRKKARDALLSANFKEAAKQLTKGATELLKITPKPVSSASKTPKAGHTKQEK